jgi:hypothetical protein
MTQDDIQVGDLWQYEGNGYTKDHVVMIARLLPGYLDASDGSVNIVYMSKDNDIRTNITVSYLRKKYRKLS